MPCYYTTSHRKYEMMSRSLMKVETNETFMLTTTFLRHPKAKYNVAFSDANEARMTADTVER
jgi:hypothetical protein